MFEKQITPVNRKLRVGILMTSLSIVRGCFVLKLMILVCENKPLDYVITDFFYVTNQKECNHGEN